MTSVTRLGLVGASVGMLVLAGILRRQRERASRLDHVRRRLRPSDGGRARFRETMVDGVPEPARAYLLHAISSGTLLARAVELDMGGTMRLAPDGPWLPMRAHQLLAASRGFVWEASVGQGLMRFSGADSYVDGHGRMDFRLLGLVPVARAIGPDTARSARGRLAGESIWNPAALLPQHGATWERIDERSARATLTIDGEPIALTLTIDPNGRLRSVSLPRWGDQTSDGTFAAIPFGMEILEERTFAGYTIPVRARGGWWYGTDRFFDFFHPLVTGARFLPGDDGRS